MILREIGSDDMEWIDLALDGDQESALVSTVMSLETSKNIGKFLSGYTTGSLL
jgi:hypothetical protein